MTATRQGRRPDKRTVKRALAAVRAGYSPPAVARHIGCDPKTVRNWMKAEGVERGPSIGGALPADWTPSDIGAATEPGKPTRARAVSPLSLVGEGGESVDGMQAIPGVDPTLTLKFINAARVGIPLLDIGDEFGWARKRSRRAVQALETFDNLPESDPDYALVAAYVKHNRGGRRDAIERLHEGDPGYRAIEKWLAGTDPGGAWDPRAQDAGTTERPLTDMSEAELLAVIGATG